MRLIKAAFALLIALDLIILLLAVFVVKPLWILLSIMLCALLKGLHNQIRIRQKISQYYQLKNKLRMRG
jgi:hypothetical protein